MTQEKIGSMKSWLFLPLEYAFEIEDIPSDYLLNLEKKLHLAKKTGQGVQFEIPRSQFIQAWLWGPIRGEVEIRDGIAHVKTRFIGHNIFTVALVCASILLAVSPIHLTIFFRIFLLAFVILFRVLSFHVSVLSSLSSRLRRFFTPTN